MSLLQPPSHGGLWFFGLLLGRLGDLAGRYIYIYIPSLKLKIHVVKVGVEQDRAGGTAPCWVHVQHSWENMAIGTNSLGELVEKNVWNRLVFYHSILLESSMNELALTQVGEMTCFNINHWGNPAPNSL